jgi:uncharacterized protein
MILSLTFMLLVAGSNAGDDPNDRTMAIRGAYRKLEVRIPMRDGVRLFTSLYIPNDAAFGKQYPVLLKRTPYSCAPYGADRYPKRLYTEPYEQEKFIFGFQDVRGQHMSEGDFVDMRPMRSMQSGATVDESTDTYDTIDWLVKNIGESNGKVGLLGISYPGFYAAAGAVDSHPALKAVSPQAPIADWWHGDDMHRNGAFNIQMAFGFFYGFDRPHPVPTDDEEWPTLPFPTPDAYAFYLGRSASSLESTYLRDGTRPAGKRNFFVEAIEHPNYDSFWQARNLLPRLKNVRAPMLVVGGWHDAEDPYGPLNIARVLRQGGSSAPVHLVMGPWVHGGWVRTDGDALGSVSFGSKTSKTYQPIELAWFVHHLKGGPDPKLPAAWMFETGANRWRSFSSWPPTKQTTTLRFYPAADGSLNTVARPGQLSFISDPAHPVPYTQEPGLKPSKTYMVEDQRFASRRPDVVTFMSAPLTEDVTIAGPVSTTVVMSTTGTDADVVVKLMDGWPDRMPGLEKAKSAEDAPEGAQQIMVRGEPFRMRFRDDPSKPVPMKPGVPATVRFELDDVLHTFQRGHRIIVQVQSSWFPYIDMNPQTYVDNIAKAGPEAHRMHTHTLVLGTDGCSVTMSQLR